MRVDVDVAAAAAAGDEREAKAAEATSSSCTSGRGLLVAPPDKEGASASVSAGEGQSSLPAVDGGVVIDAPPRLPPLPLPLPLPLRPAPPRDILSLFFTVSPSAAGDGGALPAAEEAAAAVAAAAVLAAVLAAARADAEDLAAAAPARAFPVELARGGRELGAGVVAAPAREPAAAPPVLLGVITRRVTIPPATGGTGEGLLAADVGVVLGDATGVVGRLPLLLPPPMLPLLKGGVVQPRGSGCKT